MTRVADTSFIITFFDRDDPRHEAARDLARDPEPIVVPPEVLGETLGVVHARHGYDLALGILDGLYGMPNLSLAGEAAPVAAGKVYREGEGPLSWVDAAVVARCRGDEAEPLAFDEDIREAAAD